MWNLINYNYSGGEATADGNGDGNAASENGNATGNNYNLWSMLGYEDNPSAEKEASQNNIDQKEVHPKGKKKKKASKHFVRVIDEDGNDVLDKTLGENINEMDEDSSDKKKKKKKKKKKSRKTFD
ncbi:hypothetical protein PCYB_093400 [Plasmodium cynomolgi strain B]|uniref:Uncharacterized protein n=1 Tax=Plasmodium cynomolgi (strain B) TaxID=1120755 RepID=K6UW54_PLACD|nr:hypothetical protein PCYB_093400 [Plasmodium cynomolgi strain B]GAB66555.1 hypothetical protein PCYB_093400 [Plasmodium cynomolgi strain B]